MFFINNNTGFISGKCTAGADYEGIVARTTNGGINWNTSFASGTRELYGIQLINDSIGFAVGYYITYSNSARVIVKTTDRGISWSPSISYWNNSDEFFDVHFPSIQTGYVVGLNFFNVKTTNNGDTWSIRSPIVAQLNTVYFINNTTGFVGGYIGNNTGEIFKTTNGGESWNNPFIIDSSSINRIKFVNPNIGYAVTYYKNGLGSILKTTNAGINWIIQKVTSGFLEDVYFINELTGYACSGHGEIWKTTDGGGSIGIRKIETDIPSSFSLYQNYPNPFNPETDIKFEIPKSVYVKLNIYDINGRTLECLVNEEMNPGIYKVNWNASNQPSGVYFYRIETGDFKDTKRMILIK